jgi:hypothetical protein
LLRFPQAIKRSLWNSRVLKGLLFGGCFSFTSAWTEDHIDCFVSSKADSTEASAEPLDLLPDTSVQKRFSAGFSFFGPSLSGGTLVRGNNHTIHEIDVTVASLFILSIAEVTYAPLEYVSPHWAVGPYLGPAVLVNLFELGANKSPNTILPFYRGAYFLPAVGIRALYFKNEIGKKQSSPLFGVRIGFPLIFQLEGGYAQG